MRLITYIAVAVFLFGQNSRAEDLPPDKAEGTTREAFRSHIIGNVPRPSDFDVFMKRDLRAYFSRPDSERPDVSYELLRDGPTQTGISYPKFYVWVQVKSAPPRRGAARVAAIEKERFEVLQYVDQTEIADVPAQLQSIFPPDVARAIEKRAKAQKP